VIRTDSLGKRRFTERGKIPTPLPLNTSVEKGGEGRQSMKRVTRVRHNTARHMVKLTIRPERCLLDIRSQKGTCARSGALTWEEAKREEGLTSKMRKKRKDDHKGKNGINFTRKKGRNVRRNCRSAKL